MIKFYINIVCFHNIYMSNQEDDITEIFGFIKDISCEVPPTETKLITFRGKFTTL